MRDSDGARIRQDSLYSDRPSPVKHSGQVFVKQALGNLFQLKRRRGDGIGTTLYRRQRLYDLRCGRVGHWELNRDTSAALPVLAIRL